MLMIKRCRRNLCSVRISLIANLCSRKYWLLRIFGHIQEEVAKEKTTTEVEDIKENLEEIADGPELAKFSANSPTATKAVWCSKKPEKETEKGLWSSSWGEKVVTGNEGGWCAKTLVNDSEKGAGSAHLIGQTGGHSSQAVEKISSMSHHLPPQIFASGNEVAGRNRRRKRGCCQKLLPPYLLQRPETAILVARICFCSSESEVCRKC
ncbi:hypothetical protein Tco_0158035 [Tanacetum coccineum]